MESVLRNNIISAFFQWQFFDMPKNILKGWRNFLKFNLNYFSVQTLLKTLFSHWHRYSYSYGKKFDPGRYFEAFIFNMMSRIIGAILRLFFIFIGLLIEIFIFLVGGIIFLGWLILPLLLIGSFFYGFGLLF
jgi:hypothetical protein